MPPALHGTGVLVTRPAPQAEALCRAIEASGGFAVRFPTLEIRSPADPELARALLRDAAAFDLLVFVSANAVAYAAPWLPPGLRTRFAAVGQATAQALRARGLTPSVVPAERWDSEGLLALPDLQQVAGWRVLIVRGEGGRALIADTLAARGAVVRHAEIYRRAIPVVDAAPLVQEWERRVQAIVTTSIDVLDNLLALLGPAGTPKALATPLVVVSERMAAHARDRGFEQVVLAAGASDEAIIQALGRACPLTPQAPHLLG